VEFDRLKLTAYYIHSGGQIMEKSHLQERKSLKFVVNLLPKAYGLQKRPWQGRKLVNMKTLVAVMVLVAAMVAGTGEAQSQGVEVEGNKLYEWSLEKKRLSAGSRETSTFKAGLFGGYVMGVHDALENRDFCSPAGGTRSQILDVVTKYLEAHPEIRHKSGFALIIEALKKEFPCKK
jgi:hypothetical protein